MKLIKNNPPLSLNSIKDKIKTPFISFIVNPTLEESAAILSEHFVHNVFKFEVDGIELTIEEAIEKHLFDFKIWVEPRLKDKEWILITEDEIYYSKGDSSK